MLIAFRDPIEAMAPVYGLDATDENERRFLLRDILTDCRHYADHHGIDFSDALNGSHEVYLEEVDNTQA